MARVFATLLHDGSPLAFDFRLQSGERLQLRFDRLAFFGKPAFVRSELVPLPSARHFLLFHRLLLATDFGLLRLELSLRHLECRLLRTERCRIGGKAALLLRDFLLHPLAFREPVAGRGLGEHQVLSIAIKGGPFGFERSTVLRQRFPFCRHCGLCGLEFPMAELQSRLIAFELDSLSVKFGPLAFDGLPCFVQSRLLGPECTLCRFHLRRFV